MRSFASDNNSGVHPLVMDALIKANKDHTVGYGDDPWSKAAEQLIKEHFGEGATPFLVFNGTGANSVALQAVTRPFNSIICAATAHIFVDECGAPAKMSGCPLIPVNTPDGKLTPELIKPYLKDFGVCHHSQPGAVYISQATELGTLYTPEEVEMLADFIHSYGLILHMDGARLANACVALDCTFKKMTVDAGVDILSFGGTKNGMMMGEAVISFLPEISANLKYYRKQSAQLASKHRYLAAQFLPYLGEGLWRTNALHANAMALKLLKVLQKYPQIRLSQEHQSNQLFFYAPKDFLEELMKEYFFYYWNEEAGEVRLVTSWDTTDEDIAAFESSVDRIFSAKG
jgi:threonine aldolase